ncbi:DUF92 domain-containing protein [Pyrococcus horikoshii]|nr:TIGR00297 family protein [Pyrococcus horikoshii]
MVSQGIGMEGLLAIIVIPFLGYLAYKVKALDKKGSLIAILLGYAIIILGGYLPFLALLTFLIAGTLATRIKWNEKNALGLNEDVYRSVGNVLGNGLAPLLFLILEVLAEKDWGWAGVFSAIATANADTLASEIGKAFGKNPIMITTFRRAKVGESGAVSLVGEIVALLGALMIGIFAMFSSYNKFEMLLSVTIAGFLGSNIDSLVGATLERRGYLDNNGTNFVATLLGGVIGILMFLIVG